MAGSIISKMAFVPPSPGTYDRTLPGFFTARDPIWTSDVACVMHPETLHFATTILYSHGNAEDLGGVKAYAAALSEKLQVNVISYDYEGYGLTSGSPGEAGVYRTAESVYHHLVDDLRVDCKHLILMGRSLGSGPAVHLAAHFACAGLILISPITSAIRVVLSEAVAQLLAYGDIFVNIKKIQQVECPVLIMHGLCDEVVPYQHGLDLSKACHSLWKLVSVVAGSHNNAEITSGTRVMNEMTEFLLHINRRRHSF